MPEIAATTSRPCCQPASSVPPLLATGAIASSGKIARMGMTAISWNSNTAKAERPLSLCISLRSCRLCSTMAVEESASMRPMPSPCCSGRPMRQATPVRAPVVSSTCRPPVPRIGPFSCHKRAGRSSNPTRNNISTTPNSAKCITSFCSPTNPSRKGPMMIPASR